MQKLLITTMSCGLLIAPNLMAKQKQPNIIMFLVDDMGWQDTSVPFYNNEQTPLNRRFHTPNMERMAEMGVKFTQAYACAISSPTRCSLMSGMNASRHRVTNWTLELNQKTDSKSSVIDLPEWNFNGIQPESEVGKINNATPITPLPQILKENGYWTIHCGKAHFGARTTPGANPSNMGFDVNIGLTIEAIREMKESVKMNKPFYLYMSHYAVHSPYDEDKRFTGKYRGKYDEQLKAGMNENEARYAALVEGMDKSLGDIMDYLEQNPEVASNTILLFMSDNGGQGLNNVRQGIANRDQNYPARAGKGSAFMGGVREPMMVYWPGVTKPGTECEQKVIIEDFFPTILEMAGVRKYETIQEIDGKSFVKSLKKGKITDKDRAVVWHFPNLWGETQNKEEGYGAYSAILKGDYHLIYTWETGVLRLFNIKDDIGEQNDLAIKMPEKVKELASELSDFLRERNAQRPSIKATGNIIPFPDEIL